MIDSVAVALSENQLTAARLMCRAFQTNLIYPDKLFFPLLGGFIKPPALQVVADSAERNLSCAVPARE